MALKSPSSTFAIDQTSHILQKNIKPYFLTSQDKIPFQSSPFPLDNKFEMTLFSYLPLTRDAHLKYAKIFKGNYNH